jgi:hypothetical protein
MAGLGRKEWSPGDTLNAADVNGYLMDQSVMVFAGTAARASAIPTPSAGMVAYSTATSLQVYNGSAWVDLSTGYGVATGGTSSSITVGGINYTLLTFTTSGTLTNTKAGLFDVAIIGGGGSGAGQNSSSYGGGGAGGGGLLIDTLYLTANQTVTIGAGGAAIGSTIDGNMGNASRIGDVVATGGGCGGRLSGRFSDFQSGSGGGSAGPFATPGQGNDGGPSHGATPAGGGGGGGSAAAGSTGILNGGGAGGAGYDISQFIGGSTYFVCAGGGGSGLSLAGGAAGSVGAGTGGRNGTAATNATNYGCGGGGFSNTVGGGAGFAGVVYVRFRV